VTSGTSPTAVIETGTENTNPLEWVYYRGTNGDLLMLEYSAASGWVSHDFGPMEAGTSASATRDPKSGRQWVYWVAANGQLVTVTYSATQGWALGNLGVSVASGASPSAVAETGTESANPRSWVYYTGSSEYVMSLVGSASLGWSTTEL
jgi:hypothetical protein